jgi:hypothetical protein
MPPLTRWYVRTSFLYLVATLGAGVWLAAQSVWPGQLPGSSALSPVYLHLFMVGWATQLIFGVANWMFPVYTREAPRRSEPLGAATYALLNAGLLLRIIAGIAVAESGAEVWRWLLVVAVLLLLLAGAGFVFNTWGRVKG